MTTYRKTVHPLSAIMLGLLLGAPAAEAKVEGSTLIYSPSDRLAPLVNTERGDVKAGQRIATDATEVREVMFPDGTVLTVAPNSEVFVEGFEYSEGGSGRLVLRVDKGLIRIAGGTLSNTAPILIKTPTSEIALDAASAVVEVGEDGRTRASLLAGRELRMTSNGQTKSVVRPGYELVATSNQAPPSDAARQSEGAAASDAFALGTGQFANQTEAVAGSGLGGGTRLAALATESPTLTTITTPTTGTGPTTTVTFQELGSTQGGSGSGGFGPGAGVRTADLSEFQPSESNGDLRSLTQNKGNARIENGGIIEETRSGGRTTNRLFNSADPFTQKVESNGPVAVADKFGVSEEQPPDTHLEYLFRYEFGDPPVGIVLDRADVTGDHVLQGGGNFGASGPFLLQNASPWPQPGATVKGDIIEPDYKALSKDATGSGSLFKQASHFEILQAGFWPVPAKSLFNTDVQTIERRPDNFLLIEVRPGKVANEGTKSALDPTRTERFLFATGNVDAGRINSDGTVNPNFQNKFAVDRFFISAGLDKFEEKDTGKTVASDIRAFLRKDTSLGLPLTDSGVFVVNTASSDSGGAQNSLLHADFGMAGQGTAQQSTLSVTIGEVKYVPKTCGTCDIKNSVEVAVSGRTIASSHGDIVRTDDSGNQTTAKNGTVAISSPLTATAAGGRNPQLERPGYAGYLVLENFIPESDQSVPAADRLSGGTEHAVGGATAQDQKYAYLRLATATGQEIAGTRSDSTLTGWISGLAEQENVGSGLLTIVPIGSGTDPNNVTIQTNAATNRVQADIRLTGHAPMTLGGPNSPSAFIDDNRFAAANERVAMVNVNVLRDREGKLPASLNLPDGQPIENYKHLQWGFFLGDTDGAAGSNLKHLHLGTWVAGRAADPSQFPATGSATYQGHAIGNVFNAGSLYTAVGSYQNTWDFAQRRGTVNMNFDGAPYNGVTALRNNSAVFEGTLSAANRAGGVVGNFVGSGSPPGGVIGRFGISETAGSVYRASGTFGAEKK